ncbi:minichromosome maintenance protein 1 [Rhodotorula toruloides]|uniref:Minichromosome maintenance protein 1 n=1 Tax=Rhodotorula toruloides TaxID=5286 RepID=A0A511KMR1_RHOTO|nr:minichromosome maintenance protein 1 [Rhodotorula toruloides]
MATLAAPSFAPSSQPTTPSTFDPSAYLSTDFTPLPAFPPDFDDAALQNGMMVGIDPAQTTSSGSGGSSGSGASGMGGLGLGQPGGSGSFATGQGMVRTHSGSSSSGGSAGARGPVTRLRSGAVPPPGSRSAASGAGGGGGFISFDPDRGSDLEDDEEDDEDRQVEGRPKKRKSVRDLRSAAATQASAPPLPPPVTAAAATSKSEGEGGADGGEDKARRKIQIEYIEEKSKRHITFSKRKAGIMKKAYELSTLTGTQVLLLVVSESGWVYTFTTDKFKPLVKEDENGQLSAGQKLIAACLEAKDGPPNLSAAYQPTTASSTGNFEANSSVHGGQISLKTGQRSRPIATNRRVSGKARPAAIQPLPPMPLPLPTPPQGLMGDPTLPVPPNSAGIQMGQLPSPLSGGGGGGYLDPNPISPHGPRGSYPPRSGGAGGSYSLQQQQQQDYAEMMQRADMLQLQQQQQQQQQGAGQGGSGAQGGGGGGYDYDLYSTVPYYPPHDSRGLPPLPHSQQQQHDAGHPPLQHQRSFSHSHSVPHTPHRTLHHQASHGHLSASAAQQQSDYSDPYGQQNYTHHRDPTMMDPRNGGGWQTPHHHLQQQEGGSAQGTPVGVRQAQQHALYAGDDYAR